MVTKSAFILRSTALLRMAIYCVVLLLAAFGTNGCNHGNDDRVEVAGKVLIDNEPITSGTIRFVPAAGRPASSAIQRDGSFELASERVDHQAVTGVPRGDYRVQVSASKIENEETIRWNAPEKYADFRTSGLNVTIDKPIDDLRINLTWASDKQAAEAASASGSEKRGIPNSGISPAPRKPTLNPNSEASEP